MRLKDFVKQSGGTMSDLFNLPLAFLDANPDNIRLDTQELRDHIRGIADSIIATGFLRSRPLTVRLVGERAIVVDGNCRFAAAKIAASEGAELLTIPCVPEAVGTTEAERIANMVLANSGLPHSPIEMTAAVKRLVSYGWTDTQIAKRLGRSRQYVTNLLDLAGAAPDVQLMITNGTVSATEAIKLIRSEGDNAGEVIREAVAKTGKARVTAKDIKPTTVAPEKPVKTPVGLIGAVREMLRIWDDGDVGAEFDEVLATLRELVA